MCTQPQPFGGSIVLSGLCSYEITDVHLYYIFQIALYITTQKVLKSAAGLLKKVNDGGKFARTGTTVSLSLLNQLSMPLHARRNVVVHPCKNFLSRPVA